MKSRRAAKEGSRWEKSERRRELPRRYTNPLKGKKRGFQEQVKCFRLDQSWTGERVDGGIPTLRDIGLEPPECVSRELREVSRHSHHDAKIWRPENRGLSRIFRCTGNLVLYTPAAIIEKFLFPKAMGKLVPNASRILFPQVMKELVQYISIRCLYIYIYI